MTAITPTEQVGLRTDFFDDIRKFNDMYKLHTPNVPTVIPDRLKGFASIIQEEIEEAAGVEDEFNKSEIAGLVALADWLGDIIIYCASEMLRWGLDPAEVLRIIMASNFSKLGADGEPIYDERGKVLKGPGYWKPEPRITNYIKLMIDTNNKTYEVPSA